jgi:hypothetical protein
VSTLQPLRGRGEALQANLEKNAACFVAQLGDMVRAGRLQDGVDGDVPDANGQVVINVRSRHLLFLLLELLLARVTMVYRLVIIIANVMQEPD